MNKQKYKCAGCYGYLKYLDFKEVLNKDNTIKFKCYLSFYSSTRVEASPYSEIYSEEFGCVIVNTDNVNIQTTHKFKTEAEARVYFETTNTNNIEERYYEIVEED